jgi:predicted mannosyl-3-phosphoglycerate phosphatase (HAD superfamily)
VPAAFVATQDGGGGAAPDTVTVTIPSLPTAGIAQCSVWAGDGSHRIPMMERANETPAFDSVRIIVIR